MCGKVVYVLSTQDNESCMTVACCALVGLQLLYILCMHDHSQ